ncbi:hypothetical protein FO519_005921 [Halicephalobus sp. NKZ332]|nr:hypothetical protein FO519_005921 [Halicephalobus sp. NKZ332]
MPATPTVKLLFEEDPAPGDDDQIGNWRKTKINGSAPSSKRQYSGRGCALFFCLVLSGTMLLLGVALGIFLFNHFYADCIDLKKLTSSAEPELTLEEEIYNECGAEYPWKHLRLPTESYPTNYRLKIHPILETKGLKGSVNIDIEVRNATSRIVLHAQDLNLTSFTLRFGSQLVPVRHLVCSRLSQWAFEANEDFPAGSILKLSIDYDGKIQTDLSGLYTNSHQEKGKGNRTILSAITQFEPTHARKMLPCFDEPSFKATFDISIIREKDHLARANMPLIRSEEYEKDLILDQFAPSVKMPTYLLAVAILDRFAKVRRMTKETKKPVEINLFAPADSIKDQTEFGLDTGVRALEYFEDFFDIPVSLPKIDLVALDDFAEGAMENWGLITFRDTMLSSHAVSTEVEDPAQIGSIFDAISYQKGASIVQMLRGLAGKDAFRTALQKYLRKFEYDNAKGEDLWKIIQSHVTLSTSISVTEVAEAWTTQVGYPMIRVELTDGGSTLLIKDQERFLFLEEERFNNSTENWPIPVQYQTNKNKDLKLSWLEPDAENVKVLLGSRVDWVVANAESLGYYRVLYDLDLYKEFTKQLKARHSEVNTVDRAALLNDAFCFLKSGHLGAETVMDLIQYIEDGKEIDRIPWVVLINHLKSIENLIGDSEIFGIFQRFERSLLLKAYERLGWERPESHVDRMLQTDILAFACRLQLSDCVKQAQQRFHQWVRDKNSVFVDIQPFIIEEGVRRGSQGDWERIYKEYLMTTNPSQRLTLLIALASTEDIGLIHRFMAMCLNPTIVRPNVLPRALGYLMQNKVASLHVWRFFRMNYHKVEKLYGGTTTLLGTMIKSIIENFNTEFELKEVEDFFEGKNLGASRARVDQAVELIKLNVQWRRLNEKSLESWLRKWAKSNLRKVFEEDHIATISKMPYVWTSVDTRNALLASLVPAGLGVASVLSARPHHQYFRFLESSSKPKWADFAPAGYAALDLLTLSPLGYASYLVYKSGGGFDYTDTAVALALYGTNLLFAGATVPLLEKKNYKCLAINTSIVFGTALATAVAFYRIDEKAGLFVAPYAAWTAFYAFLTYNLYKMNTYKEY